MFLKANFSIKPFLTYSHFSVISFYFAMFYAQFQLRKMFWFEYVRKMHLVIFKLAKMKINFLLQKAYGFFMYSNNMTFEKSKSSVKNHHKKTNSYSI